MPTTRGTAEAEEGSGSGTARTAPFPTLSNQHDMQLVSERGKTLHLKNDCPADFALRSTWLDNIEMQLTTDPSGIRWMEVAKVLPCVLEHENILDDTFVRMRTFTLNCVVPFKHLLTGTALTSTILAADSGGASCKLLIPTRIWNAMSVFMYALVKPNIPDTLRSLWQSVSKGDGAGLISRLRKPTNNIAQKPIELLEMRKSLIKLTNLTEWPSVRGDILTLFGDWQEQVDRGDVPTDEQLSLRKQKDFVSATCDDVLHGIGRWIGSLDNVDATLDRTLVECDTICTDNVKRLQRKRLRGEEEVEQVGMYASDPWYSTNNTHDRWYQSPNKGGWVTSAKGRGKGWGPPTSKGRGKGNGPPKGKGKGKGKGLGKGKGFVQGSPLKHARVEPTFKGKGGQQAWNENWGWWNNNPYTPYTNQHYAYYQGMHDSNAYHAHDSDAHSASESVASQEVPTVDHAPVAPVELAAHVDTSTHQQDTEQAQMQQHHADWQQYLADEEQVQLHYADEYHEFSGVSDY
jgi:hypothetical protein